MAATIPKEGNPSNDHPEHEFSSANALADFVTEGQLTDKDLRGYIVETISRVLAESNEAIELVSPSQRRLKEERRSSTLVHRALMLLLTLVCILLELVALFLTLSLDTTSNYRLQFRSISVALALLLSCVAITWIMNVSRLQSFSLLSLVCLFGDTPMLSLFEDSSDILYIGFATIAIRLIAIMIAITGDFRERRVDFPERRYLRFMNDTFGGEMTQLVDDVMDKCNTTPEQHTHSQVRTMVRRSITEALEEAYEELRKPTTEANGDDERIPHHSGGNIMSSMEESNHHPTAEDPTAKEYLHWLRANSIRDSIHSYDRHITRVIIVVLCILTLLTIGNVAFEFSKIFANQPPIFPETLTTKYTDRTAIKREFATSDGGRSHSGTKVHIVIVDGLRDDFMEPGASSIGNLFARSDVAPQTLRFHTRAQLPSFSVPNWMSILSGAPPELTGVTGNLQNGETAFDTMYGITKSFSVHSGMTGTPWWADLVKSTLPYLGGDGTVDAAFVPAGTPTYPWLTSDPADQIRGQVAVQAAKRSTVIDPFPTENITTFYELFLTHFSDVDKQGHEYGVDTQWNEYNSYRKAVDNKTIAIENIIREIDNNTLLIVTSDHGHVKFGGHGGSDSILRDTPLVFFQKNSTLAASATSPVNFMSAEEPRSSFNNKYSNMDLCATICAVLGLPSPRQSLGIFVEEIVTLFVPVAQQSRHYHDLLVAKIRLVQAYKELMDSSFFSGQVPTVLMGNANIEAVIANATFGATGPFTQRQYADMVREVLADYHTIRNVRFHGVVYRNLVLSILIFFPAVVSISAIFLQAAFMRISSIFDSKHPLCHLNRVTCLCAAATIVLYVMFSILTYVVLYYGVYDHDVWDSTATHTPSVAAQYLVAVIAGPVVFFTVFTKVPLAHTIYWHVNDVITEYKTVSKVRLYHVTRWIGNYLFEDFQTLIFATRSFKQERYLWAHTYIYYITAWVTITSMVLLFMCFPFSFLLPAIFSVEHVTALNQVYRFRVISVMFMMVPIQLACILMMLLRPHTSSENMTLWDLTFLRGRLASDLYRIMLAEETLTLRLKEESASATDGNGTTTLAELAGLRTISTAEKLARVSMAVAQIKQIASWLSEPSFRSMTVSLQGGDLTAAPSPAAPSRKSVPSVPETSKANPPIRQPAYLNDQDFECDDERRRASASRNNDGAMEMAPITCTLPGSPSVDDSAESSIRTGKQTPS